MKALLLLLALLAPTSLVAGSDHEDEGHEEAGSSSVGPDKAVTAAEESKGIRLSDKARAAINIRTEKVGASGKVPPSALLKSGDETFVYWARDGWFKRIRPATVDAGDEIVVEGVALLRVAELDAFTAGEVGHAH